MWRVAVADDESYMREALLKLINWSHLGCELLFVAQNGKDLLAQLERKQADIIITDIKMPLMGGLEVAKFLNEKYPETQIIVLSAYQEFDFARQAIQYNVVDYVLKTALFEELPRAIEKAKAILEKQKSNVCRPQDSSLNSADFSLFVQVDNYIQKHFKEKISLNNIANALHSNASYISRMYKDKTGINLFDRIQALRIEEAKMQLRASNQKISVISAALGFEDTGYFSKVFKKVTGLTPKEFRNEVQGNE